MKKNVSVEKKRSKRGEVLCWHGTNINKWGTVNAEAGSVRKKKKGGILTIRSGEREEGTKG